MNHALGINTKKIRLFSSKVLASLRRALFVDALDETTLLDKPLSHVEVGFIEESLGLFIFIAFFIYYFLGLKKCLLLLNPFHFLSTIIDTVLLYSLINSTDFALNLRSCTEQISYDL